MLFYSICVARSQEFATYFSTLELSICSHVLQTMDQKVIFLEDFAMLYMLQHMEAKEQKNI